MNTITMKKVCFCRDVRDPFLMFLMGLSFDKKMVNVL